MCGVGGGAGIVKGVGLYKEKWDGRNQGNPEKKRSSLTDTTGVGVTVLDERETN